MSHKLKEKLRYYYSDYPTEKGMHNKEEVIFEARKEMRKLSPVDQTMSFMEFFRMQFTFIRKKTWICQFMVLLLVGFVLAGTTGTDGRTGTIGTKSVISVISALLLFLFLIEINELSRAFVYKTVEVELSTRFTVRQVVLTRLIQFGMGNIFALTVISVIIGTGLSMNIVNIFMYICVPFLITAFGCLFILNHVRRKESNYYCVVWTLFVAVMIVSLSEMSPALYEASLLWGWYVLFDITLGAVIYESYLLVRGEYIWSFD